MCHIALLPSSTVIGRSLRLIGVYSTSFNRRNDHIVAQRGSLNSLASLLVDLNLGFLRRFLGRFSVYMIEKDYAACFGHFHPAR